VVVVVAVVVVGIIMAWLAAPSPPPILGPYPIIMLPSSPWCPIDDDDGGLEE